jgi:hypothetical protein
MTCDGFRQWVVTIMMVVTSSFSSPVVDNKQVIRFAHAGHQYSELSGESSVHCPVMTLLGSSTANLDDVKLAETPVENFKCCSAKGAS